MSNSRQTHIWEHKDGGWMFHYRGADNEMTEDGPFKTYQEAADNLWKELDDLSCELEGEL